MEVVLRQDVDHVGLRGDVVNVARGYARNYLLPRGLAEVATPGLKRELERRESLKARNEAKTTGEAQAIAKRLEAQELKFEVNAGPTGSLFGSVTATNVVDRLWEEQKIRIDRRKLDMQAIKRIGRYTVEAEIFADVTAELRILVVPEGGELPPDEPEVVEEAVAAEAGCAGRRRHGDRGGRCGRGRGDPRPRRSRPSRPRPRPAPRPSPRPRPRWLTRRAPSRRRPRRPRGRGARGRRAAAAAPPRTRPAEDAEPVAEAAPEDAATAEPADDDGSPAPAGETA